MMKFHVEELLNAAMQHNDEKDKIILALGMVIDSLVANTEYIQNQLSYVLDKWQEELHELESIQGLKEDIKQIKGSIDVELTVEV